MDADRRAMYILHFIQQSSVQQSPVMKYLIWYMNYWTAIMHKTSVMQGFHESNGQKSIVKRNRVKRLSI